MSANYKIFTIDLSQITVAGQPAELVPVNNPVYSVTVLGLPAGASVDLRFGGRNKDPVPLLNQGITFDNGENPEMGGVYYDVSTLQTGFVTLYVDFGGPCGSATAINAT